MGGRQPAASQVSDTGIVILGPTSGALTVLWCPPLALGGSGDRTITLRPTAPDTLAAEEPVLVLQRLAAVEVETGGVATLLATVAGDKELRIERISVAIGFIDADVIALSAGIAAASISGGASDRATLGGLAAEAATDKGRRTTIGRGHAGAVLTDRVEWARRITVPATASHTGAVVAAELPIRAFAAAAVAAVAATLLAPAARRAPRAADIGPPPATAGLSFWAGASEAEAAAAIVGAADGPVTGGYTGTSAPAAAAVLTGLIGVAGAEADAAVVRIAGQILAATAGAAA